MRLYDPHGQSGSTILKTSLPFTAAHMSNIMEDELEQVELLREGRGNSNPWNCISISYRPSEIVCLHLA